MRCLRLDVKRNRRGEALREGRVIEAGVLRIGRNSAAEIHLPDSRVRLHHASLSQTAEGRLTLEVHGEPVEVNGAMVRSAHLRPGTSFHIGPYRCEVELPIAEGFEAHDFALTVELEDLKPARTRRFASARRRATSLNAAGFSPWRAALFVMVLTFICLLLVPRLGDLWPRAAKAASQNPAAEALRASWTAGPLATGHRGFGSDCTACHSAPFEPVSDSKCLSCHAQAAAHITNLALRVSAPGERCATCHRDHRGPDGMKFQAPGLCRDCHADIHAGFPQSKLRNVADFADAHPSFALALRGAGAVDPVALEQTSTLQAIPDPGLKFPHDVHLAARGIEAPAVLPGQATVTDSDGTRVKLRCGDCHRPAATGVGFEPVRMQANCSQCHRLEFQPGNPRVLPHGPVEDVMATLRDFYAAAALGSETIGSSDPSGMTRVLHPSSANTSAKPGTTLLQANRAADAAAHDVFAVRVCVTCHLVTATGKPDLPYRIAPVAGQQHLMPQAHFEHAAHAAAPCATCHAVNRLHDLKTLAMPTVDTCRSCHAGSTPVAGKVTSGCALCHDYHAHPDSSTLLLQSAFATPAAPSPKPGNTGAISNSPPISP